MIPGELRGRPSRRKSPNRGFAGAAPTVLRVTHKRTPLVSTPQRVRIIHTEPRSRRTWFYGTFRYSL